jgi:FMN reductase [NAD(P)H]
MNSTLETLSQHRSIRRYSDRDVAEETLQTLIAAVQQAPSSKNGQQVSLVVVRDAERRQRISEIAGGQRWIAQAPVFVVVIMDFHKTALGATKAGLVQRIHESLEGTLLSAVDAGIILGNLMTAAESMGMGIVPIGGIRRDPEAMIELLGLPPLTFPVAGMCLGYADGESHVKPRLPMASFRHDEVYDDTGLRQAIDDYDETLVRHWQQVVRRDGETWSQSVGNTYQHLFRPEVKPALEKQGFLNDK